MHLIGVDVGGTFTDLIYTDTETNETAIHKVPTTPDDPSVGAIVGIDALCRRLQIDPRVIDHVLHGTTIATNAVLTLDEGATAALATLLVATDVDTDDATLQYTVTVAPANGQLELTGDPGMAITVFSQAQLDASQVVYVHDDSETTGDSFTFTVSDGTNDLPGQVFSITVTPVNDAPVEGNDIVITNITDGSPARP